MRQLWGAAGRDADLGRMPLVLSLRAGRLDHLALHVLVERFFSECPRPIPVNHRATSQKQILKSCFVLWTCGATVADCANLWLVNRSF
eukprot:5827110-Amphidinium_carterae.1